MQIDGVNVGLSISILYHYEKMNVVVGSLVQNIVGMGSLDFILVSKRPLA